MAARDRPTLGIAHLTVVPRNFEPKPSDGEEEGADVGVDRGTGSGG